MRKNCKFIVWFIVICALNIKKLNGDYRKSYGAPLASSDNMLIARCRSECSLNGGNMSTCENLCIKKRAESSAYKKYGSCPQTATYNVSMKLANKPFEICTNQCKHNDFTCHGRKKCCEMSCGTSCQDAIYPRGYSEVPPIPKNVGIADKYKNFRTVLIYWDMPIDMVHKSPIFYVLESRSHIGVTFSEDTLDSFKLHMPLHYYEEKFNSINVRRYIGTVKLRPGRFYQFRIASVNHLGTLGYSTYTTPFQLAQSEYFDGFLIR